MKSSNKVYKKSRKDCIDVFSKHDRDWKPEPSHKKKIAKELTEQSQDSNGESDDDFTDNRCPVCHKGFSRSAALMCHIKQNHSYMLQKREGEYSLKMMKSDIEQWKNRINNPNKSSDVVQASSNTSKSRLEKVSDSETLSDNSTKDSEYEKECLDQFQIIGGSASFDSEDGSVKPSLVSSILEYEKSNGEMHDPDQSFSIVRAGLSQPKKRGRPRKKKNIKRIPAIVGKPQKVQRKPGRPGRPPKVRKNIAKGNQNTSKLKVLPIKTTVSKNLMRSKDIPVTRNSNTVGFVLPPVKKYVAKHKPKVGLMKAFHSVDFSNDDSADNQKFYECFVCHLCFSSSSLLTYHHMRQHMLNNVHQCRKCGKVLYDRLSYAAHMQTHKGKS